MEVKNQKFWIEKRLQIFGWNLNSLKIVYSNLEIKNFYETENRIFVDCEQLRNEWLLK